MELSPLPSPSFILFDCFNGLARNEVCITNIGNSGTFFGPGEALAAFGLIFAVSQLASSEWRLTLQARSRFQANLYWYVGTVGLLLNFIAVLKPVLAVSSFAEFWLQIGSLLCIGVAPFILYRMSTTMCDIYSPNSCVRFYNALERRIYTGKPEDLESSLALIEENLDELCRWSSRLQDISGKEPQPNDPHEQATNYALSVLGNCFAEERMSTYIVTKRLDFLTKFYSAIAQYRVAYPLQQSMEALSIALLFNDSSHLHSDDPEAIWVFDNIYRSEVFSPDVFSKCKPLSEWKCKNFGGQIALTSSLEVFLSAFNVAYMEYFYNPSDVYEGYRHLFTNLSEYLESLSVHIPAQALDRNASFYQLKSITNFSLSLSAKFHVRTWDEDRFRLIDRSSDQYWTMLRDQACLVMSTFRCIANTVEFEKTPPLTELALMAGQHMAYEQYSDAVSLDLASTWKDLVLSELSDSLNGRNTVSGMRALFYAHAHPQADVARRSACDTVFINFLYTAVADALDETVPKVQDVQGGKFLPDKLLYRSMTRKFYWINGDDTKTEIIR